MAEGLTRQLGGLRVAVYSAGLEPKGLHPLAVKVMEEIGIDIRDQQSKRIDPVLLSGMDWIVTVCGHADERCPVPPPTVQKEHWPIEDPARATGSEADRTEIFRKTRDELRTRMKEFLSRIL